MINIKAFVFNAFQENTYVLSNEFNQCWIVDPGMYDENEIKLLTQYITDNKLQPQAIINTHGHIDHVLGIQSLVDKYNIPFGINEKELPVLNNAMGSAMLFGFQLSQNPKPDFFIAQSGTIALGNETLEIRFTPGHSPGSISFYYPEGKWVLAGDALFSGSIGRTDLPGGDHQTLIDAIHRQLLTLPADTTVYSGHGPATNIGNERQYNPFLHR